MKRIVFVALLLILISSVGTKAQLNTDSLKKVLSMVDIKLKCSQLNGQLPKITLFSVDPVDLFNKTGFITSTMTLDSVAKCWDEIIYNKNSDRVNDMFSQGAVLCGEEVGQRWIATTAIIKDKVIYIWSLPVDFVIGKTKHIILTDKNRIKL